MTEYWHGECADIYAHACKKVAPWNFFGIFSIHFTMTLCNTDSHVNWTHHIVKLISKIVLSIRFITTASFSFREIVRIYLFLISFQILEIVYCELIKRMGSHKAIILNS